MNKAEIKQSLLEKWIMIRSFFTLKWDGLRLTFAIYMADSLQRAKNKRFYVLDNGHGKLIWLCKDDINVMKRPRYVRKLINGELRTFKVRLLPKHITHLDVMRDCYYYTPESRNNSNGITVEERNSKRKAWLDYMEKVRMDRMFGKVKKK